MERVCGCGCGATFTARNRRHRFASAACRKRASRGRKVGEAGAPSAEVVEFPRVAPVVEVEQVGSSPTSVRAAVASGDELATLRVLRMRLAEAVDDPNCPTRDLAALQRSIRELAREIKALELAEQQEAEEEDVPEDEEFDASAV